MRGKLGVSLVSALVMILLGVGAIVLLGVLPENLDDSGSRVGSTQGEAITDEEIASLLLRWIETQRDEKGVYFLQERCLSGSCSPYIDHRAGFFAIWARLTYYRFYPSQEHLDLIERDLDVYRDREAIPDIQNYYWNCAIMLDIGMDETLPLPIRSKAEKICDVGFYTPAILEEVETMLEENPSFSDLDESVVGQIQNLDQTELFRGDLDWTLYNYAAYASDFVARYEMYGHDEDAKLAKGLIALTLDKYINEVEHGRSIDPLTSCMLASSTIDGYLLTSSPVYLDISEALVSVTETQDKTFEDETYCLYTKTRLTKHARYSSEDLEIQVGQSIDTWFDYPGFEGYHGGMGTFTEDYTSEVVRSLPENSMMIYVLLNQSAD